MPIDSPKHPFHVEVFNCFDADERALNGDRCGCGLERLRLEHALMKAFLDKLGANKQPLTDLWPEYNQMMELVNK